MIESKRAAIAVSVILIILFFIGLFLADAFFVSGMDIPPPTLTPPPYWYFDGDIYIPMVVAYG